MATYVSRPAWGLRVRAVTSARLAIPLGLGLLVGLSLALRTSELGVGYWIDEGLSVGIADRPLADIPGVLRQDGSPPLYYCLLHVWMALAGHGEKATHTLSLLVALATVPVAFWCAGTVFGRRAAWVAAVLAALNPFITEYAQESRMYALVVLLGFAATALFLRAYAADGRPSWRRPVAFGAALAAELYTHNWALFFGVALFLAWLVLLRLAPAAERRDRARDGALGFGLTALLYLPWLPTLLLQAAHTGAPWSRRPGFEELTQDAPHRLLGTTAWLVVLLGAGAGAVALVRAGRGRRLTVEGRAVIALAIAGFGTVLIAWAASQVSPAWVGRYLAVAVPPVLLLSAAGLAAARGLGLAALLIVAVLWAYVEPPSLKSNVREVATAVAPSLEAGDVVVSTHPEQVPVVSHYLPAGLRYATPMGFVPDTGVTDWRDGVERLQATSPERDLRPILDGLPPGGRLVLIRPIITSLRSWRAPWTKLVRLRSEEFEQYLTNDPRFHAVSIYPPDTDEHSSKPRLRATVLVKTRR